MREIKGQPCPKCGCQDSKVLYTRHYKFVENGKTVITTVRQRLCRNCGKRFRTSEKAQ